MINFRDKINTNFEQMQKDRNWYRSDLAYARIFSVSVHTIVRYMWKPNRKVIRWPEKIQLDILEVNKMRHFYSDEIVAGKFNCSASSIITICWTRRSLWIERANKKWTYPIKIVRKKLEPIIIQLKQDNWIYKEEKPYWEIDTEVQLCNWPHPFLYQKLA
jgi:hypothetical protein